MKKVFQKIFYQPKSREFELINSLLSFLTILSVISISAETVKELSDYKNYFYFIEIISTFFFTLEYIGRIWGTNKKIKYIFSFYGFIDLISILPTILGLGNLTFLKSVRLIRILRFLRILRISKFVKYTKNQIQDEANNNLVKINLEIYLTAFFLFAFFSAVLIWLAEGGRESFQSIPESLLWSVKILLGGVPSAGPETF
jgi:voltage-gated potassium channel